MSWQIRAQCVYMSVSAAVFIDNLYFIVSTQTSSYWHVVVVSRSLWIKWRLWFFWSRGDNLGKLSFSCVQTLLLSLSFYLSNFLQLCSVPSNHSLSAFPSLSPSSWLVCQGPSNALCQWWGTDTELLPSIYCFTVCCKKTQFVSATLFSFSFGMKQPCLRMYKRSHREE